MTRRAKDVADTAASALSVVASAVWRPYVHPWMLAGPDVPRHAVRQLDDHGPKVAAALAGAAVQPAVASRVAAAIGSVRAAFADLADALDVEGGELRRLLRERPFALAEIRRRTDALGAADAVCRAAVTEATASLPALRDLLAGSPWEHVSSASTREQLARVPTDALPGVIARNPDLLAHLTDPDDPARPAWLADALDGHPGAEVGPAQDASLLRVARVRAACAAQDDDTLLRAAYEHPRLIGDLDGVPLRLRLLANRLAMRADLRRMRARDVAFENVVAGRRAQDATSYLRTVQGAALDAWLANDEITALATVDVDRPAAQQAELRALVTLTQQLLHDRVDQGRGEMRHRQVIKFTPEGRIVELWGTIDDATEQVAVYVGGTGTTVRQFGWPTNIVRALLRDDPAGGTAVVTWMGAEFPSAIGTHSPFGRFARAAAAPLRDCVEGLGVPDDVPITVIGHSYGGTIVGAAEALGLRADRIVLAGVPGIGPGIRSVEEYPDTDALGRPRRVTRYALTAPGDLIRLWRKGDAALASVSTFRFAPARTAVAWMDEKILGADPMTLPGIVDLDPGIWETDRDDRRAGEILYGPRGHADTVEPGTTSFRRICAVVQGRDPREIAPPHGVTPFRRRRGRSGDQ